MKSLEDVRAKLIDQYISQADKIESDRKHLKTIQRRIREVEQKIIKQRRNEDIIETS